MGLVLAETEVAAEATATTKVAAGDCAAKEE